MKHEYLIIIGFVFLVSVLIAELISQRLHKKQLYNLSDSTTNTAFGISDRVFSVFWDGFLILVFVWIHKNLAFWHIPITPWTWILALMATDLLFYTYHRLGHETRLFWAIHSAHHQSEEYNLTVGFRISIFQTLSRSLFYCVLPLIGFEPMALLGVLIFHGIYQLPLHTTIIPKLGFLEYIFVTPSHHRVHHASNEMYLDKNYGGVFIIWDRLFGSFQEEVETEPCIYGLTEKTGSMNFIFAHFHGFRQIAALYKRKLSPLQILDGMARKPSDIKGMFPAAPQYVIGSGKETYAILQLMACAALTILLVYNEKMWNPWYKLAASFMIVWMLLGMTGKFMQAPNRINMIAVVRNLVFPVGYFFVFPHKPLELTIGCFYATMCLFSIFAGLGWLRSNKARKATLVIAIMALGTPAGKAAWHSAAPEKKLSDREDLCIHIDSVRFTKPVSIAQLKRTAILRVAAVKDSNSYDTLAGYQVESYHMTILSKNWGYSEIAVNGNKLIHTTELIAKLAAGDFIMFSQIRVRTPDNTSVFIPNHSAVVRE